MLDLMIPQLLCSASAAIKSRRAIVLENIALRQQLQVFCRSNKAPRLTWMDRGFWVLLSRLWAGWRDAIVIVKPETVINWHRKGFRLYCRWKSRKRGRPRIWRGRARGEWIRNSGVHVTTGVSHVLPPGSNFRTLRARGRRMALAHTAISFRWDFL